MSTQKTIKKPWGREIWLVHNDKYAGKILEINKGHRLSRQYHKKKHETWYIVKGKCIIELDDDIIHFDYGDAKDWNVIFTIAPNTIHRLEALEDTILIEFSTPELDDVVRVHDDYGRE